MSGTVPKKIAQLPVLAEPLRIGKIKAWSTRSGIASAELVRRALFGKGWAELEAQLITEYGGALTESEVIRGTYTALPPGQRQAFAVQHNITAE